MHRFQCSTEYLDGVPRRGDVFALGLLCEQTSSDSNQRQAQLGEHWQRRQRPGGCDVEHLSKPRIVPNLLRPPRHDLHARKAQGRASVDEKGGFVLVGLDQGQLQLRPHDLERQTGEACAGADVHHRPCIAEVIGQDQAVFD